MSDRRPSPVLGLYYGFLLVTTGLFYGSPYPLFGWVLAGTAARVAVVVDCLVLVHLVVGVWKAQRLTWYLLLGYNAFELLSLAATLALLEPSELARFAGGADNLGAFYVGVAVAAGVMGWVTVHVARHREQFADPNPFLF